MNTFLILWILPEAIINLGVGGSSRLHPGGQVQVLMEKYHGPLEIE